MKTLLSFLLLSSTLISVNAQWLNPRDVLKQDGVLRISDGSSYYEFYTNSTFKSFPVGYSGRCFTGTWMSDADPQRLNFTVTAKISWRNGYQPPPDDWRIVFSGNPFGTRHPADESHLATFDCYWIIEELEKTPKQQK
jgi:hypothetical protein